MTRLLVLAMFSSAAWAELTPAETAANLASFEQIWRAVRDRHPDPRLNGLDW